MLQQTRFVGRDLQGSRGRGEADRASGFSLDRPPSLRMPQRAPGLPENSGIAAVYEDSVMGLSFRVQPWLCPFPAGDLGQVTQLGGKRTQRDDGNCKNSGNGNEPAKCTAMGSVLLWWVREKATSGPAQGLPEPSPEPWKEMLGYLASLPAFTQKFGGQGCTVAAQAPSALPPSQDLAQG